MSVYTEMGYKNRRDYLNSLAEEFGLSKNVVYGVASVLGPNEDFDGLVTHLEDFSESSEHDCEFFGE